MILQDWRLIQLHLSIVIFFFFFFFFLLLLLFLVVVVAVIKTVPVNQAENFKMSKKAVLCGTSMNNGINVVWSIKFDFR